MLYTEYKFLRIRPLKMGINNSIGFDLTLVLSLTGSVRQQCTALCQGVACRAVLYAAASKHISDGDS